MMFENFFGIVGLSCGYKRMIISNGVEVLNGKTEGYFQSRRNNLDEVV